jgi:hypothetical protein
MASTGGLYARAVDYCTRTLVSNWAAGRSAIGDQDWTVDALS